jgi:hypothetical protein
MYGLVTQSVFTVCFFCASDLVVIGPSDLGSCQENPWILGLGDRTTRLTWNPVVATESSVRSMQFKYQLYHASSVTKITEIRCYKQT